MKTLQHIWNWQTSPNQAPSLKRIAVKAMIWFFTLMIGCTLVSRTASSVTTPIVKTQSPQRAALTRQVFTTGTLELLDGMPVTPPPNLPVKEILVKQGARVQAGDLLFICDMGEVQRQLQAKNLDAKAVQAELAAMAENALYEQDRADLDSRRAQEDLDAVGEMADLELLEAQNKVGETRKALRDYDAYWQEEGEEEGLDGDNQREALRSAYRAAQIAYDKVVANRDKELRAAQRAVEDAGHQAATSEMELKKLALEKIWLEAASLREIAATSGEFCAPIDGVVKELVVKLGGKTSGETAALISSDNLMRFTATISEQDKKFIQPGSLLTLQLAGGKIKIKDIPVLSILPHKETPGTYQITAEVEQSESMLPGLSATGECSTKSALFDSTIPYSALYGVANSYYVLVVEEKETALGTELIARKQSVTLLDHNGQTCALSGLNPSDRIIVQTDRPLRESDRVRVNP